MKKRIRVKILVVVMIVVLLICLVPYGIAAPAGMTTFHALVYEADDYYAANEDTDFQTGIVVRILGHEVYRDLTVDGSAKTAER